MHDVLCGTKAYRATGLGIVEARHAYCDGRAARLVMPHTIEYKGHVLLQPWHGSKGPCHCGGTTFLVPWQGTKPCHAACHRKLVARHARAMEWQ